MDQGMQSGGVEAGPEPAGDELRNAKRFALLIRTAKIVCENGEYLCIVRDISATGLRLRLFHAAPSGRDLAIELGNGDTYPLECVWERDGHAGFRFLTPIDVHAFMEEPSHWPRRPIRLRMRLPGLVMADGAATAASVLNISRTGALIETERFLALEQKLQLEVQGLPLLGAHVCWRSGQQYGLAFRQTFTFEELAVLAAQLQPFAALQSPAAHGLSRTA